jgi:hypothetical protein
MRQTDHRQGASLLSRLGALCYAAWGLFHINVAADIWRLGAGQQGLAQGRLYQFAAYMLTIAVFVLVVGLGRNWRKDKPGYWLSLAVVGWALDLGAGRGPARLCRSSARVGAASLLPRRRCLHHPRAKRSRALSGETRADSAGPR